MWCVFVFILALLKSPLATYEHTALIVVKYYNQQLGYRVAMVYYGSVIQVECISDRPKKILLTNPANVVIKTEEKGAKLVHNMTADESLLLGQYECTFDGKDPKSASISYRFCSPKETDKCPETSCRVSYCVITEDNKKTDTCKFFMKKENCFRQQRNFYACTPSGKSNHLCSIFTNGTHYLPWYERSGNGCNLDRTTGSIFVRDLKTVDSLSQKYAKIIVNNVIYYALPIGSTIIVDKLPHEIYFNCSESLNQIKMTWFHSGHRSDSTYLCDLKLGNVGKIEFPAKLFEKNKFHFINFLITGNIIEKSSSNTMQIRTYGNFLYMPEPPVVVECAKVENPSKIGMKCFFSNLYFHDRIVSGVSKLLRWELSDIEQKSTNSTERGLWIEVDKSDGRDYVCVGVVIYEACALYGNVRFSQTNKRSLNPQDKSCIDNLIHEVTTTEETEDTTTNLDTTEKDERSGISFRTIVLVIFICLMTPVVIALTLYFLIRWYREKKIRDLCGTSSTLGATDTGPNNTNFKSKNVTGKSKSEERCNKSQRRSESDKSKVVRSSKR